MVKILNKSIWSLIWFQVKCPISSSQNIQIEKLHGINIFSETMSDHYFNVNKVVVLLFLTTLMGGGFIK